MNKYINKVGLATVLLLLLSVAVAAASKVAIVKVLSGSATLDNQAIAKAAMASDGQRLEVAPNSRVRVQWLGSKDELIVEGQDSGDSLIISKTPPAQATDVGRNSAAVAADIGNKNTALALVSRQGGENLEPILPPVLEDKEHIIRFKGADLVEIKPGSIISIEVASLDGKSETIKKVFDHTDTTIRVAIHQSQLEVGRGYRLILEYGLDNRPKEPTIVSGVTYSVAFRILSPEEKEFLRQAEQELVSEYNHGEDVYPLLNLAALYQEYDQTDKVLEYLGQAYNSPHLGNKDQWKSLNRTIRILERALAMRVE
jgi:hypothetical protein